MADTIPTLLAGALVLALSATAQAQSSEVIDSHPTGSVNSPPPGSDPDPATRRATLTELQIRLLGGGMIGSSRPGPIFDAQAFVGVRLLPLLSGGGWVGIGTMVLPALPTASLTMPNYPEPQLRYQGGLWLALHFGPTLAHRFDPWVALGFGVLGTTHFDGFAHTWVNIPLSAGVNFRVSGGIHLGLFVQGAPQIPVSCLSPPGGSCTNGELFAEFLGGFQVLFGPGPREIDAMR